jgi:ATP-dependent DNA ligase
MRGVGADLSNLMRSVREQGLEGLVARRRDRRLRTRPPVRCLAEHADQPRQELVIGGYTVGGKAFDALVLGYYEKGRLLYASRTRNGFTPPLREQLPEKMKPLHIPESPFADLPEKTGGRWGQGLTAKKMKHCRWLTPELVGQFEFVEWTPDNHYGTLASGRQERQSCPA